jgi:hypothetical protein
MNSFKQYLEEGRAGPLYHATNVDRASFIVGDNKIMAKTIHKLKPDYRTINGVSLTRDYKFAIHFGFHEMRYFTLVIFELDQAKLSQKFKIMPINYYNTTFPIEQGFRPYKGARRSQGRHLLGDENNESEEFVLGNIKDVSKYIVKIHVCSDLTKERIDEHYPRLAKHPKLWFAEKNNEKGYFYNA